MEDFKDIVVSTRIRLARNINGLPFPNKLDGQEKIYAMFKNVQSALDEHCKSKYYRISDMSSIEAQAMVEKHIISPDLLVATHGAVLVSEGEDISIMLNEEDHIREQCFVRGLGLQSAYAKLQKIDKSIAQKVDIAYDKNLGYLTACPTNIGAGMRASVMLFLPALTMLGAISSLLAKYQQAGWTTRGVYGEGSDAEGYMYQISNQASIAQSESEIIARMNYVVTKLVEAEKEARNRLLQRQGIDLKDEIMRAYGALNYACKMSSQEFMKKLALVKLGVYYKYINAEINKLNQLVVMSQPAMLCKLANKKLTAEERDITRIALIKKILSKDRKED